MWGITVIASPSDAHRAIAAMLEYYSDDLQDAAEQVVRDVFSAMISASPN